jgi:type I restriction-modification system DNA methylase subunit
MSNKVQGEPQSVAATAAFEQAFSVVQSLARDFETNKDHFLSPAYQESEVRKDYIDKFLIALGWDVNHDRQKNPFEQEVKVERGVNMQGSQRRADYAFYAAPNFRDVRFFAEAKKPFGDIASQQNYFQTIRYGWNAKTPIAILTDFEQFQILDCRYKPNIDSALTHCIRKFRFSEYADKDAFAFIYYLFSREAVANGSLEKFAGTLPKKHGKAAQRGLFKEGQSIDDAFLEELDEYRDTLARGFKNNNPNLDGDTLTEMTQRTIDRLVFMRFIEDKQIQPEEYVSNFGRKNSAWRDFIATSRRLDGIYNGIVFKRHAIMDDPSFKADEDAFADICRKLSHDNSPYDFNSIPIHILGSIYERFLGKVIVTTDKRARLEEKPEVRKAGGVYYTPEYIVRYIVENTVGKVIEGRTPAQIESMRFADIACGSGSFLLGVFDLLLRYHVKWFNENPEKAKKAGCVPNDDGGWSLSLHQRRHILVNNIYGVDIDHQAVEVAQLSLYLKLLQDETTASAREHQLEFHETILPSLNKNIVCGNSLIGTDILTGQLLASDEERKLNPMDYEQRFPEIMREGGFDAVVGNPPYLLLQPQNIAKHELDYLQCHYQVAQYKMDIFHLFIEQGLRLVKDNGFVGYITPASFLTNNGTSKLREEILSKSRITTMVVLPDGVFQDASVDNVVFTLIRDSQASTRKKNIFPFHLAESKGGNFQINQTISARQEELGKNPGMIFRPAKLPGFIAIAEKMEKGATKMGDFARINFGMQLRDRAKYPNDVLVNPSKAQISLKHKKCIGGSDVQIYRTDYSGLFCFFDKSAQCGGCWDEEIHFAKRKVLIRQIGKTPIASLETEGLCCLNALFMVKSKVSECDEAFLLGLINSKLLQTYWSNKYYDFKNTFPKIKGTYLGELPIRKPSSDSASDKFRHDKIVALVEQMIAAKKQLAGAQSDKDKDFYGNKCAAIDRQIDALVYELYELTPEEIKIVEGATEGKSAEPAS